MEWSKRFLLSHGIQPETATTWNLELTPDTIDFPYQVGKQTLYKKRRARARKFQSPPDIEVSPFGLQEPVGETVCLCEGESDTLRLWQELQDENICVYGIPGCISWKQEWAKIFNSATKVYVIFDNDTNPLAREAVTEGRKNISRDLTTNVYQVYLPSDVKDVCEYFAKNTKEDFLKLLKITPKEPTIQQVRTIEEALGEASNLAICAEDLLPESGWLRDYVSIFRGSSEAPVEYHLATGLTILSLGCSHAWLESTVAVPLSMYTLILGPSSSARKSTAMKLGLKVLRRAQQDYGAKMAKLSLGDFSDTAVLSKLAQSNRYPYLAYWDEFSSLMKGMHKEYKAQMREIILEAHGGFLEGKTTEKNSFPGGPVFLSILSAMPEEVFFNSFTRNDIISGYLTRFLLVFAGGEERYLPFPDTVSTQDFAYLARQLASFGKWVGGAVGWSKEARSYLGDWYVRGRKRWSQDAENDVMGPYYVRSDITARKIAALLRVSQETMNLDRPITPYVQLDDIQRSTYYMDHMLQRVRAKIYSSWSPVAVKYKRIEDLINANRGISLGELHIKTGLKLYELKQLLQVMREDGRIVERIEGDGVEFSKNNEGYPRFTRA